MHANKTVLLLLAVLLLAFYSGCTELEEFFISAGKTASNFTGNGSTLGNWDYSPPESYYKGTSPEGRKNKLSYDVYEMEQNIQELVNQERISHGLNALEWNEDLAHVAREHSENLAIENEFLTKTDCLCPWPFIHHEGFDFGLYQNDRLNNRNIYYFGMSAENIFAEPVSKNRTYKANDSLNCPERSEQSPHFEGTEQEIIQAVQEELQERTSAVEACPLVEWIEVEWKTQQEIEAEVVVGWMNSPGHRKNILKENANEAGVGIVEVNDYLMVTHVFIERADCGYMQGPCCEKQGYYPYCFVPMACQNGLCK